MGNKKLNLSDALFSKVRQKVLGILFRETNVSFSINEIIRLAKSGSGAVQREIEKLSQAEIVTVKIIKNKKLYRANPNSPIYSELKSIVLKTFGLADILRETIVPLKSLIDVAFIYGSFAKHEDTAKSDIDLMFIGDNLSYRDCFEILAKAEEQVERKINPTIYTLSEWKIKRKNDNNFIKKVIEYPKIFLIGTEEQLNELS